MVPINLIFFLISCQAYLMFSKHATELGHDWGSTRWSFRGDQTVGHVFPISPARFVGLARMTAPRLDTWCKTCWLFGENLRENYYWPKWLPKSNTALISSLLFIQLLPHVQLLFNTLDIVTVKCLFVNWTGQNRVVRGHEIIWKRQATTT